MKRILM